jgi:hypothetical protein
MGAIVAIILSFIGLTIGGVWLAGVLCGTGWLFFIGYLFGRKAVRMEYEARREQDIQLMLALARQFQPPRGAPSIEEVTKALQSPRPQGTLESFLQQIT